MIFPLNATQQSINVFFADTSGAGIQVHSADVPYIFWRRTGRDPGDNRFATVDLGDDNDAWTIGGIRPWRGGWHRVDLQDEIFDEAGGVVLECDVPGINLLAPLIEVTDDPNRLLDLWNAANAGDLELTGPPVATDGTLTLYRGADYYIADSRSLNFTVSNSVVDLSVSGTTAYLEIRRPGSGRTTFVSIEKTDFLNAGGSTQTMRFEMSRSASTGSASFPPGTSIYRVVVRKAGARDIPTHTGAAVIVEMPDPSPFGG